MGLLKLIFLFQLYTYNLLLKTYYLKLKTYYLLMPEIR